AIRRPARAARPLSRSSRSRPPLRRAPPGRDPDVPRASLVDDMLVEVVDGLSPKRDRPFRVAEEDRSVRLLCPERAEVSMVGAELEQEICTVDVRARVLGLPLEEQDLGAVQVRPS